MATILTATQVAEKLNTDARTARKFLRAITPKDAQPGKGSRWGVPLKDMRSLTSKFNTWSEEQAARREAAAAKAAEAAAEVEADEEPEFDDLEPTDEELAELDD